MSLVSFLYELAGQKIASQTTSLPLAMSSEHHVTFFRLLHQHDTLAAKFLLTAHGCAGSKHLQLTHIEQDPQLEDNLGKRTQKCLSDLRHLAEQ